MKSLFEQLGDTYYKENWYLIPDLRLPEEEEKEIMTWIDFWKQIYTKREG